MSSSGALDPLFDEFPPVSTEAWEQKIRSDLGGTDPEAVLRWDSIDGVSLTEPLRRDDRNALPHVPSGGTTSPLADPADDDRRWQIRQDICHSDLSAARSRVQEAVRGGVGDLGITIDPVHSQRSDTPVDTAEDLRSLTSDLSPSDVRLHFGRGPAGLILFVLAETEGLPLRHGSVEYDPVASLATGAIGKPSRAFNLLAELNRLSEAPDMRTVSVDLRPYHDAGASAVQELTAALATLTEIVDDLLDRGFALGELHRRLQFYTATSSSYFVEIAKLRALRLLVPQVFEAFGDEASAEIDVDPSSLRIQTVSSRRRETVYDPHVNMLRGTTAAMAAVIGGCDVLTVRPHDARLGPPDAFSARIARNVQLILRHEAHFDVVADPAAGSYYVECLTDRLARKAWSRFQELESNGGVLDALRDGRLQREIEDVGTRRQEAVDERTDVLVGTTHYPALDERRLEEIEDFTCNNGNNSRGTVSADSLASLRDLLADGRTVSELARALRPASPSLPPLTPLTLAKKIEALRLRTERAARETESPPTVQLAPIGAPGPRSARATFARNVFGVGGFEVRHPLSFDTARDAVAAAVETNSDILVLCSADEEYADLVSEARAARAEHDATFLLVVAGPPDEQPESLPVDEYIFSDRPLLETLETMQRRLDLV